MAGRRVTHPDLSEVASTLQEIEKSGVMATQIARRLVQAQSLIENWVNKLHSALDSKQLQEYFFTMKKHIQPLLDAPYFRKTLLSLLGTAQGGSVATQLAGNMLEALRLPYDNKAENAIFNSPKENEERVQRDEMYRNMQRPLLEQMQSTVQMLEQIELNASAVASYMGGVLGTVENEKEPAWLKRNYIWLAGCMRVLLRCDFALPGDVPPLTLEREVKGFSESKQIEYADKAREIKISKDKNTLTGYYRAVLERVEKAVNHQIWEKNAELGNNLDDRNLLVILKLSMRLACKAVEKTFFQKTALPQALCSTCVRLLALDEKGESRELFALLQGNSRNEGSNQNYPAYKVIEHFTKNLDQYAADEPSAKTYIFNLRFLARFLNIYDANLTRVFSNAVPNILKKPQLAENTELIAWMVTFF